MNGQARKLVSALLFGVLLYFAFAAYTGFPALRQSLGSFHWIAFAIAVGLASTNYLIRFLRWQYYLRLLDVRGVTRKDSLLIFLSGFVLTVTPGKVGEVFKSAVLAQTHQVPIARTAPIVVAERLSDVIGVVVLILAGSAGFHSGLPWALAGAGAVVTGLIIILWEKPSNALLGWMDRHPKLGRFAPKLREAVQSLRMLASPTALIWPMVLSVFAWACEGIGLWVLLRGFGTSAPLLLSVFFYETASLAGALIPLPGGLGVVEGMLRAQLVGLGGVPTSIATASMILVRFATLWWAVAVGFCALAILRQKYPSLRTFGQGAPTGTSPAS
jgi:glycosyltransferase 2 family protein